MGRKTNYKHIPVQTKTWNEIDNLKKQLGEYYNDPTYDELVNILIEKNKKIILSNSEVKKIIGIKRGVKI
jgi:hypothetical protein